MYNNLEFLDILNIMSFVIGLMNLEENMTQGDKQEILEQFNQKADIMLTEIHKHLQEQDDKIDKILRRQRLRNASERLPAQ